MSFLAQRLGLNRYEADELYKKALAAYEKRNLDEALLNLTDALALLPNNSEYYAARGFIYLEDGLDEEAQADFERALRLHPFEMLAHYGRGILAYRAKNWKEAQAHFTDAFRADPRRPETLYYVALVHHHKGENTIAYRVMQQAHNLFEAAGDRRKNDAARWLRTLEKLAS
jgi:tetratricopeptide (TPR) repeat protein